MAKASPARRSKAIAAKELARQTNAHPCGDCAVCCTSQPVQALGKPAGLRCTKIRDDAGKGACGIYRDRPAACAGYECVWRLGALGLSLDRRPDKLGLILDVENTHASGIQMIVVREMRPDAMGAEPVMVMLNELAAKGHVLYLIDIVEGQQRCRLMGPEERVRMVKEAARRKLPLISRASSG